VGTGLNVRRAMALSPITMSSNAWDKVTEGNYAKCNRAAGGQGVHWRKQAVGTDAKNHFLLNHPLWLVTGTRIALSPRES
jgi:hypothetical protein